MNEHESAKEVAGKAIGKHGLIYITIIVAMVVGIVTGKLLICLL